MDDEFEDEIYDPVDEMIVESEAVEVEEVRQRAAKGVAGLVRPLLTL